MRATEFIRQILDIVDTIEDNKECLPDDSDESTDTYVASVATMKTLAGGPNEPKHISQMKSSTFPLHENARK